MITPRHAKTLRVAASCGTPDGDSAIGKLVASRVLVVAAHPDDETIGAGALIRHTKFVHVVQTTDGAPRDMSDARALGFASREAYAVARRAELVRALACAGVPRDAITCLNFVDQRASFGLQELTLKILDLLEQRQPDILLTHAYEGGHPDHDAVAFACHMACRMHSKRVATEAQRTRRIKRDKKKVLAGTPHLWEFACYNGRAGQMRTYEFLPSAKREHRLELDIHEQECKLRMLRAFETQARVIEAFLPPRFELFREAPEYDFTRPPHEGKLFYENFDWGIEGSAWRELASRAQEKLGIGA